MFTGVSRMCFAPMRAASSGLAWAQRRPSTYPRTNRTMASRRLLITDSWATMYESGMAGNCSPSDASTFTSPFAIASSTGSITRIVPDVESTFPPSRARMRSAGEPSATNWT